MTIIEIKEAICDEYCRHPFNTETQAELNEICKECPLNELPSVTPTQKNTQKNTLENTISRESVLKGIEELKKSPWANDKRGNGFEYLITEALDVVADLCVKQEPSVTQKPDNKYRKEAKRWKNKWLKLRKSKTGHWIGIDEEPHEDFECDVCGYVCSTFTANIKPSDEYKYCPNCGVKMQERSGKEV